MFVKWVRKVSDKFILERFVSWFLKELLREIDLDYIEL